MAEERSCSFEIHFQIYFRSKEGEENRKRRGNWRRKKRRKKKRRKTEIKREERRIKEHSTL